MNKDYLKKKANHAYLRTKQIDFSSPNSMSMVINISLLNKLHTSILKKKYYGSRLILILATFRGTRSTHFYVKIQQKYVIFFKLFSRIFHGLANCQNKYGLAISQQAKYVCGCRRKWTSVHVYRYSSWIDETPCEAEG